MNKSKATIILLISFLTLSGCASRLKERGIDDSQAPMTGSPMTSDWITYNEKAEREDLPHLVYLSTSLELEQNSPKYLTDNFVLDDNEAVIFAKWKNVSGNSEYKLNIIDPRGRSFQIWKLRAGKASKTYWWSYRFYIKDAPASKLPGKWHVEIYMNDRFVTKKVFVIGESDKSYEKHILKKNSPSIMITPFLHEGKESSAYGISIPILIAQNLTVEYPGFRIVDPQVVADELASPPEYAKPSDYIKKALVSELTHSLIKKYNVKMIITGYYKNPGKYEQKVKYNIFIIDAHSRKIRKEIKCSITPRTGQKWDKINLHGFNKIYKKVNEEGKTTIYEILKKG